MTYLDKINAVSTNTNIKSHVGNKAKVDIAGQRQGLDTNGKDMPSSTASHTAMMNKAELDKAINKVSDYVQNITRQLNFSVDEDLGKTVVTVVDQQTGNVIRQIPSEEMLELSRNFSEIKERTSKGILYESDA